VPENERLSEKEVLSSDVLSASSSTHNLPSIAQPLASSAAVPARTVSDEERLTYEEERQKLYQQLDDKVSQVFVTDIFIFNTLHHNIICDERDIWMNKRLILAIEFINGNLISHCFCCSGDVYCGYGIKLANFTSFTLNSIY